MDEKCGCGRCTRLPAVEVTCNHKDRSRIKVNEMKLWRLRFPSQATIQH